MIEEDKGATLGVVMPSMFPALVAWIVVVLIATLLYIMGLPPHQQSSVFDTMRAITVALLLIIAIAVTLMYIRNMAIYLDGSK